MKRSYIPLMIRRKEHFPQIFSIYQVIFISVPSVAESLKLLSIRYQDISSKLLQYLRIPYAISSRLFQDYSRTVNELLQSL